jgi:hypothetical protein
MPFDNNKQCKQIMEINIPRHRALNLTHKFPKSWQREGSGAAKNLEEPFSTAPSGIYFCNQAFSYL